MSSENNTKLSSQEIISEDEGEDFTSNTSAYFASNNSNHSTYLASNDSTLNNFSNEVNEIDAIPTNEHDLAKEKNNMDIAAVTKHILTRNKSYQFRALSRKTLSYQKRQKCVNIFWVTIFPLSMVAIAYFAAIVMKIIIPDPPEYLLCSSLNASRLDGSKYQIRDRDPNIPRTLSVQTPNALPNQVVINYNLDYVENVVNECVFWFGRDYPYRAPYENDPQVSSDFLRKRDTTSSPEPLFGYFGPSALMNNYRYLLAKETFPWAYVRDAPNVFSGDRTLDTTQITSPSQFSPINNFNYGTGFLSRIDTQYYSNFSQYPPINATKQYFPLPYFQKWYTNSTDEQMNLVLKNQLFDVIEQIRSFNPDSNNFTATKANLINQIPWGSLLFDNIGDKFRKQWNYTLQIGSDERLYIIASFPRAGFRRVAQQSQLSNAILRTVLETNGTTTRPTITTGFRSMPHLYIDLSDFSKLTSTIVGVILYPFGLSFLLPTFVTILVKEKEEMIAIMMKMHGLSLIVYYLTHYLHFYILYSISTAILVISGYFLGMTLFTLTDPWLLAILFSIWGHIQIAMAFLFSTFFQRSRNVLATTFVIVLCGVIFSFAIEQVNSPIDNANAPVIYFIWPPFAFYRALSIINHSSYLNNMLPMKLSDLNPGCEVFNSVISLALEYCILMFLTIYFYLMIPTEYGVNRTWHFILAKAFNFRSRSFITPSALEAGKYVNGDEDVRNERTNILSNKYCDNPLVVKNISKIYNNGKVAIKDIAFTTESCTTFGLLGPSGAGKTTLLNVLTGLYKPTEGDAILNGLSISTSISDIHRNIGVCPQRDILWDNLTVEEHLLFYARIRGIPSSKEHEAVLSSLKQAQLLSLKSELTENLDNDERRRLSIAIALVGEPALVFLDEPTAGLDPKVRRSIWKIICNKIPLKNDSDDKLDSYCVKNNSTIILATQSMEEAEVLCNKIGIMSRGTLRCMGAPSRLKQLYGRGFRLNFSCKNENLEQATVYIETLLPLSAKKLDSFTTSASYEFEARPGFISLIFKEIERDKAENGIDNWGLSQTSLEEVFLRVIGETDTEID